MSQNPTSAIQYTRELGHKLKRKAAEGSLGYFALFLTSFVWGTTWVASKIGIQGIHPFFFGAIRQTLGGSVFLLFFLLRGKFEWPSRADWPKIFLLSLLLFVASNGLSTWSIRYISSGLAALMGAIFPLIVVIIDWATGYKDKPSAMGATGLFIGFLGIGVIYYEKLGDFSNHGFFVGAMLALIAAFTWALGSVATARITINLNRYLSLGIEMFLAGIIMFMVSFAFGFDMPLAEVPANTWKAISYMVVFGSVITFGAMVYSLQHLPVTIASLYAYFNPIVAIVIGYLLLHEPISWYLAAGTLVTLAGVFVVNMDFRRMNKPKESRHNKE